MKVMGIKKTFEVEKFKEYINNELKRTDDIATDEYKAGLCSALEKVLHLTGNYDGYQYIYWNEKGYQEWLAAGEPNFPEKDKYIHGDMGRYSRFYY